MTKLAQLIAKEEGFFKAGALPARNHNPGDLRHSPHSSHAGEGVDAIGEIDSDADGWADLERQLQLDAGRGLTLAGAIYSWAPPSENDSARYLSDVIAGFGGRVDPDTPLSRVLEIQA
jgi:hypothetical protein